MQVLLASDGSADARRAAVWVRDAPLPSDTKVSVLTVATLTQPPRDLQSMTELRQRAMAQAHQAAEATEKILMGRWPVDTVVTLGDPRLEIVQLAEERRVDMLALGARGLRRIKRLLLGSVSLAAARYAPCPVVIVLGPPRAVKRLLLAVDGSEGSREAAQCLSLFGIARDAAVILLHVLPRSPASRGRRSAASGPDAQLGEDHGKRRADADEILAEAAAALGDAGGPIERVVVEGDAAKEIVRVARSSDVDLVALGARGLRTIRRLLLGSVSETVLHRVGRPVLVVRQL